MERIVFLDGRFVPAAETRVSVMDRGFLFVDGSTRSRPSGRRGPPLQALHLAMARADAAASLRG